MKLTNLFVLICLLSFIVSCKSDDESSSNNNESVSEILNEKFSIQRGGTFVIDPNNVTVDNTISVLSTGGIQRVPLRPGESMNNQITFQSPNNSITAVGMRFGDSGPITFVNLTEEEIQSGVASFPFLIDPTVCNDIAQICHDIKCYEFAYTSAGQISQANLQDIALICGACNEPSCLSLLDEGTCNGLAGEDGSPRFNLKWNGSADLDLYVTDPNGETISFMNPTSSSGGTLDIDCTGNCPGGNSENITWVSGGPAGTYTFYVNYFSGTGSVPFEIIVRDNQQTITTQTGTLQNEDDDSNFFTYTKN